jgi:hypothetical protein
MEITLQTSEYIGQMHFSDDTASETSDTSTSPRSSIDSFMDQPPSPIARLHDARKSISAELRKLVRETDLPVQRSPFLSRFIPKKIPRDKPVIPADREVDSFKNEAVEMWYVSRTATAPKISKPGSLRKVVIQTKSKSARAWVGENTDGEGLVCYISKQDIKETPSTIRRTERKHPHPLQKYVVTAVEDDATLSLVLNDVYSEDETLESTLSETSETTN